jgi:DNA-binding response OmpR family regulator
VAAGHALVFEPDAAARAEIDNLLRGSGWSVDTAGSSSEAFAAASLRRPDVVALNIHSVQAPRLVAAELRIRCGRRLPILAMTSIRDDHVADDVGAFDSVVVPDEMDELPLRLQCGSRAVHSEPAEGRWPTRSRAASAITRWRYKTLTVVDGAIFEDGTLIDASGQRSFREHADLLGGSGWELVGGAAGEWVFKHEVRDRADRADNEPDGTTRGRGQHPGHRS